MPRGNKVNDLWIVNAIGLLINQIRGVILKTPPNEEIVDGHKKLAYHIKINNLLIEINLVNSRRFISLMVPFLHDFLVLFIAENYVDFLVRVQDFCQIHENAENRVRIARREENHVEAIRLDIIGNIATFSYVAIRQEIRVRGLMGKILEREHSHCEAHEAALVKIGDLGRRIHVFLCFFIDFRFFFNKFLFF